MQKANIKYKKYKAIFCKKGDWGFLHLQPYKKASLKAKIHKNVKLELYGAYTITQHIIQVAYKLFVIAHSKIHPR